MAQYTVNSPLSIGGFDINNATAQLGLKAVVFDSATQKRDYTDSFFKKNTVKNELYFKKKIYAGLTQAGAWANTVGNIPASGLQYLWDVDATHAWYGKAVEATLEERTFDPYGINPKLPTELGKGIWEKQQRLALNFHNGGFTSLWKDGVYFFSAAHPYDSRIGGTQGNLITGTVSVAMAATAINTLINTRDPLGRPLNLEPVELYCYPTQVMLWKQVLSTAAEYGTANRNDSPFSDYGKIKITGCPWIDTTNKWYLRGNEFETFYSDPVGIQVETSKTPSHALRIESYFAIAYWAEKWQGWVGGLGT